MPSDEANNSTAIKLVQPAATASLKPVKKYGSMAGSTSFVSKVRRLNCKIAAISLSLG